MKNTKQLYKFNAKKFIAKCRLEGVEADFEWALKRHGAYVKFNDEIGLGALDGKIMLKSVCDKEEKGICFENSTELEKVLHTTLTNAIADLQEAEEALEEVDEELERISDFCDDLMKYHNKVMSVMARHRESLSEEFVEDMFKEVCSKVMTSIVENRM